MCQYQQWRCQGRTGFPGGIAGNFLMLRCVSFFYEYQRRTFFVLLYRWQMMLPRWLVFLFHFSSSIFLFLLFTSFIFSFSTVLLDKLLSWQTPLLPIFIFLFLIFIFPFKFFFVLFLLPPSFVVMNCHEDYCG